MAIEESEAPGVPEWVVTFGDMMSLLLTFFIMLVSLSEIKQNERYQAILDSMRRRFGNASAPISMAPGRTKPRSNKMAINQNAGRARQKDIASGGNDVVAPQGDHMLVRDLRRGEETAVGAMIQFPPGVAALTQRQKGILKAIAAAFNGKPQRVEIRGHAARGPHAEGKLDKWKLCYDRCVVTQRYLVELGVEPRLIRLSQAAGNEPQWTKPDEQYQLANARVEVFLTAEIARGLQRPLDENSPDAAPK